IPMNDKSDETLLIGLVSISDRASAGVYEDKGLPGLTEWVKAALASPWRMETRLIPDEAPGIERTLIELVDTVGCHLVLTTGGSGPAARAGARDAERGGDAPLADRACRPRRLPSGVDDGRDRASAARRDARGDACDRAQGASGF